ncbi:MAG: AIR synthase-related protein [Patescibacteria group bacterium]
MAEKRESDYFKETIEPGDLVSSLAKKINDASLGNNEILRPIVKKRGSFRGMVCINWSKAVLEMMSRDEMYMIPQNDGAGHKPGCFTLLSSPRHFYFLGREIIEMCYEDIVRDGGLPVAMLANQIDFKRITEENLSLIRALLTGYGMALKETMTMNITGENATMKLAITTFCDDGSPEQLILTWTGTALGIGHVDKEIDGSAIEPDMPIVGLNEEGARCNGYTKLITIGTKKWGKVSSVKLLPTPALHYFEELCRPSVNYSRTITRVHGWLPDGNIKKADVAITGIAHITGGGVWSKLGEILPQGIGAELKYMPEPPTVLQLAQKISYEVQGADLTPITDLDAYGDFHGGCGLLVIVKDLEDADLLISEAKKDGVAGHVVGSTTRSNSSEIMIRSRFQEGRILSSEELKK